MAKVEILSEPGGWVLPNPFNPESFLKVDQNRGKSVKISGGTPIPNKYIPKMVHFHEKLRCSEWSKMPNRHKKSALFFGPT